MCRFIMEVLIALHIQFYVENIIINLKNNKLLNLYLNGKSSYKWSDLYKNDALKVLED